MKNLILILFLSATNLLFAQIEIHKTYQINSAIDNIEAHDYLLKSENYKGKYYFKFLPNFKFESGFAATCGNDCYSINFGRYTFVQNSYIIFQIDSVYSRNCKMYPVNAMAPPKTLGPFEMEKINEKLTRLVKVDETKIPLSDILSYEHELDSLHLFLNNKSKKEIPFSYSATNEMEWLEFLFDKHQIENVDKAQILWSKSYASHFQLRIVMVKHQGEFYYIIYNYWNNKIALYKP